MASRAYALQGQAEASLERSGRDTTMRTNDHEHHRRDPGQTREVRPQPLARPGRTRRPRHRERRGLVSLRLRRQEVPRLRQRPHRSESRSRTPEGGRGDPGASERARLRRPLALQRQARPPRRRARGDVTVGRRRGLPHVLHDGRRGRERRRRTHRARVHRPLEGAHRLPLVPRLERHVDHAHGRGPPLGRRARPAVDHALLRPVPVSLAVPRDDAGGGDLARDRAPRARPHARGPEARRRGSTASSSSPTRS